MDETQKIPIEDTNGESGASEESMTMSDLLGPEVPMAPGRTIEVRIVGEAEEGVLVDMGLKSEGLIPRGEFDGGVVPAELKPGARVTVSVIAMHSASGHALVSFKRMRERASWDVLSSTFTAGTPVQGTIKRAIKGGFMVNIGVDAFLPASQLDLRFVKDTAPYIGQTFQFIITEFNPQQKNIVVSRRKILETERVSKRSLALMNLAEGQIIEGPVVSITAFGAFIDVGGLEGLLHIGDIAWHRINKVEDVLKTGQIVRVQVARIDKVKQKISLSMKSIAPRPWDGAIERFPAGVIVKGKITAVADFGLFVELEPGLEGLVHVSEISWDHKRENLLKSFSVGQEIQAKVILVDPAQKKLSLSIKRITSNPWDDIVRNYSPGTRTTGTVTRLLPFGAFVRLKEGIEGLLNVADLSWTRRVRHPQEILQAGQEVEVVVMEVNPGTEKIMLSMKHTSEDPYRRFKPGMVVTGTVRRVLDFGAFIELEPGVEALLRASDLQPGGRGEEHTVPVPALQVGQTIEAKVIKSDVRERKIDISVRKLEGERERDLLRKYVNKPERQTLGELLDEHAAGTETEPKPGE